MSLATVLAGCTEPAAPRSGRPGLPGERAVDVAVVGAGIAGLAAADILTRAGVSCVVLEARDRVGGRIWTSAEWPDLPIDLGASWIHGTAGNPIYREAERLGIPTAVFDVGSFEGSGTVQYYTPDGTPIGADDFDAQVGRVVERLERTAGADEAGRTSLRSAIDALPPGLQDLARRPAVARAAAAETIWYSELAGAASPTKVPSGRNRSRQAPGTGASRNRLRPSMAGAMSSHRPATAWACRRSVWAQSRAERSRGARSRSRLNMATPRSTPRVSPMSISRRAASAPLPWSSSSQPHSS